MKIGADVAVIVCSGPSLDTMPASLWAEIARAGAIVSVNGACAADACLRNGVQFTVISAMDVTHGLLDRVPRLASIWESTPAWRVTSADASGAAAESYVVEVDEADGVAGWSDHPDQGYKGGSTGMVIGNWIANEWSDEPKPATKTRPRRGFRKLAYVGLDMHRGDGRHAAGAGVHVSGFADTAEHYQRVCDAWRLFAFEAGARGVEVANLTPGTGLVLDCGSKAAALTPKSQSGSSAAAVQSVAFLACIERGDLEQKALLLIRSIRRFAGRHANAPVYTFQPRRGTAVSRETLAQLEELGVTHVDEPLNRDFPHYAIANKIFASARAEQLASEEILIFLDSDSVIVNEPADLDLPQGFDAAVRPIDIHRHAAEPDDDADPFWLTRHRRAGSAGEGDPMDAYWLRMYDLLGIDSRPFVTTTCSRQRIRAYFNSGLVAVRRSAGLFARWREDFRRLIAADHIPRNGQLHYMDQLSLAATLTRVWDRVLIPDGRYNYPLAGRESLEEPYRSMPLGQLVHIHYNRHFDVVSDWLAPQLAEVVCS